MNYLSVEGVGKSYGEKVLFENITFGIDQGQKVAIVAKNGAGKSTLLKIIEGSESAEEGNVTFRKGIKIGYLGQESTFKKGLTVLQAVLSGKGDILETIKNYEIALGNPEDEEAYQKAFEKMDHFKAWDYETKIRQILGKLKINDLNQNIDEMSGGQVKRISLAKVLIEEPDFFILDEPTNHLDLEMIEWLEQHLEKQKTTLLMVTHDRYFLEVVCNEIIELSDGKLYRYKGNFSYYLEKKAEREENENVNIDKARNLMRKELDWIRRQPKARGTKSKSRVDSFYELKDKAKSKKTDQAMELEVNMERLGTKIIEIHKAGKSFGDKIILNDFSYLFKRGEKVGIVGKNGTGKSTFLNLLTKKEKLDKGKIIRGETLKIGYYSQMGIEIKENERVIDVVKDIAEVIPLKGGRKISASQLLERFLFSRDLQYSYVSKLSGGERRKLYLLTVLMANPNFLILDEPTNDLDIYSLSVLEDFLQSFGGCVLVVSHDRYFMDKIVDHLFSFEGDGVIKNFPGNYSQFRVQSSAEKKEKKKDSDKIQKEKPIKEKEEKKKLSFKEKQEFEGLEKEIFELESKRDDLNSKVASGSIKPNEINDTYKQLAEISEAIEVKTLRWMELAELA